MKNDTANMWYRIAEYVRWTPSPHNTQPYRLRIVSEEKAEIILLPNRGLYVADPKGKFTWLTAGIFAEICSIAAHSMGFDLIIDFIYDPIYVNGDHKTPQKVACLRLVRKEVKDLDPTLIIKRQTSRLPYDGRQVPIEVRDNLQKEAAKYGQKLSFLDDKDVIKWVIELNKDSLFYDLEDHHVRSELKKWLRYSKKESIQKKDGLSAECLHLPSWLLKSFFNHTGFWMLPGVRNIVAYVYKQTMRGIGTIGWIQGSYQNEKDWVNAGALMIRLWLLVTESGLYWQPYGSIITNDKARNTMLRHLQIPDEKDGSQMVWLLLRMGYSELPPKSERLPLEEVII